MLFSCPYSVPQALWSLRGWGHSWNSEEHLLIAVNYFIVSTSGSKEMDGQKVLDTEKASGLAAAYWNLAVRMGYPFQGKAFHEDGSKPLSCPQEMSFAIWHMVRRDFHLLPPLLVNLLVSRAQKRLDTWASTAHSLFGSSLRLRGEANGKETNGRKWKSERGCVCVNISIL